MFIGILCSSRLILLYSNDLQGKHTVENHLVQFVHMGTISYAHNDVIKIHPFAVFIFAEAGLSAKIATKICTPRKFPAYDIYFYIFFVKTKLCNAPVVYKKTAVIELMLTL